MRALHRSAARVFAALFVATAPLAAHAGQGGWHGGHGGWHGGHGWYGGHVTVGIGFGPWWYGGYYPYPYPYGYGYGYWPYPGYGYPGYVVAAPAGTYSTAPAEPAPANVPAPIYYPRNGQSPAQSEADLRDCNSWATTQPQAMADASVFQRATAACMDGRGYTVR